MAQGRGTSGLQGTLQGLLSCHLQLALPLQAPCPPQSQCPPAQSSAPQMHSDIIQALPPLHGLFSTQVQGSTAPALTKDTGAPAACFLLRGVMHRPFQAALTAALELFGLKPTAGCRVWRHSSPFCSRHSNQLHQAPSPVLTWSLERALRSLASWGLAAGRGASVGFGVSSLVQHFLCAQRSRPLPDSCCLTCPCSTLHHTDHLCHPLAPSPQPKRADGENT